MSKYESKTVKLGAVLGGTAKDKEGKEYKYLSIALGATKNQDPRYNIDVEIVVKDYQGKVLAKQTNGFLNLVDPRTQPEELLAEGKISEEMAEKMRERASKLSDKVKKEVYIKRS